MSMGVNIRPRTAGCVIGLGLGRYTFVGGGVALMAAASFCAPALGAPQGGKVVAGSATIKQQGNTTVIRAADGTIINFSTYNVASGETVRYIQPNSGSRVLNRVGSGVSVIDGTITANGIVYIMNPAGIFFAKGSFVDVGKIYAGAGTITNADFLNQADHFRNVTGTVVNQGTIKADTAALIGQTVANAGIIDSDHGLIAMVSGSDVTLTRRGDTMTVKIAASSLAPAASGGAPGVENTGTINANRGTALMAAGDIVSLAVRNSGTVRARNVNIQSQGQGAVAVSGTIDTHNQGAGLRGGNVQITGPEIALNGANIDASGSNGGGQVLIGGGVHGQGSLPTSQTTTVDSSSRISADAINQGSGGTIAVWADNHTTFSGTATASGGAQGGDGGFIETSAKNTLDFAGAQVTARGTGSGKAGTWLLDPGTVTIDNTNVGAINTALNNNTNAVISTSTGSSGPEDININAAINKTVSGSGGSLIMQAGNDVNVNQPITATSGQFNVQITAGNNVTFAPSANVTTGGGSFTSSSAAVFTTGSGATIAASGGAVSITASDVVIGAGISTSGSGSISLLPATGVTAVEVNNGSSNFNVSSAELGNLTPGTGGVIIGNSTTPLNIGSSGAVSAAYDLTLNGSTITFNNSVTLTGANRTLTLGAATVTEANSGPDAILTGSNGTLAMNITGAATLTTNVVRLTGSSAGGAVSVNNAGALDLGTLSAGTLSATAAGAITDSGTVTVGSGGATFTTLSNSGAAITLNSAGSTYAGPVTLSTLDGAGMNPAAGAITFVNNGALSLAGVTTTSSLAVTANGSITDTGTVAVGSNAAFITAGTTGSVNLSHLSVGGQIAVDTSAATGAGNVTLVNAGSTTLGTMNVKGSIDVTATGGALTTAGGITVGGPTFKLTTTGANDITLSQAVAPSGGGVLNVTLDSGGNATTTSGGTIATQGGVVVVNSAGVFTAGAAINAGGGAGTSSVVVNASDVAINAGITAGSGGITLAPSTAAAHIGVNDTTDGMATFLVSSTELQNLTTTGTVTIGRADGTGTINVGGNGAIDLSAGGLNKNYALTLLGGPLSLNGNLTLFDNQTLTATTQGISGMGQVTIGGTTGSLVINSAGAATVTSAVEQLAAETSAGALTVNNTSTGLTITSLGGVTGASTADRSTVTITNTGTMTVNSAVSSGGAVVLTAGGNLAITPMSAGVTAATATLTSTTGTIDNGSGGNAQTAVATTLTANGDTGVSINNTSSALTATLESAAGTVKFTNTGSITQDTTDWTAQAFVITTGSDLHLTHALHATGGAGAFLSVAGTLNIDATAAINSAGGVSIFANGLSSMPGTIAGTFVNIVPLGGMGGTTTLTVGDTTSGTGLLISNGALAQITTPLLTLGDSSTTSITVNNVTSAAMANIEALALRALGTGGTIAFTGTASTFQSLDAQSAAMITAVDGITLTTTGAMSELKLNSGTGVTGAGSLTLVSSGLVEIDGGVTTANALNITAAGGITVNGTGSATAINLTGNNGVTINGDLTTTTGPLVISADNDADGNGTFTLASGKNINTTNQNLTIFAADVDLQGSNTINAGTAAIIIAQSKAAGIWLGNAGGAPAGDMKLSQAELQSFEGKSLQIGSDKANLMTIDTVDFSAGNHITTALSLVADDFNINGPINSGVAGMSITRGNTGTIGIGAATGDLTIDKTELSRITTSSLTIGGGGATDIAVNNVAASDLANVGVLNLGGNGTMTFSGSASSFPKLTATNAGGPINISVNLTTTTGDLSIDDGTSTGGIQIGSGIVLNAAGNLTLAGTGAGTTGTGALTLLANGSVTVSNALTTSGVTILHADADANGSGIVTTSGVDTGNSILSIIGADAVLGGTTSSGSAAMTIARSTTGTIQIGDFTHDTADGISPTTFTMTGTEFGGIVANGLTVGGSNITALNVRSLVSSQSTNISGTTNLLAQGSGGTITLDGTSNSFSTLNATAVGGITSSASLNATGAITLSAPTIATTSVTSGAALTLTATNSIAATGALQGANAVQIVAGNTISTASVTSTGGAVDLDAGTGSGHLISVGGDVTADNAHDVTFHSAVQLTGAVNVKAQNINFDSTVDSDSTAARRLTTQSHNNGTTTFSSSVGATNPLQSIGIFSDGKTVLNGNMRANQTVIISNALELTNSVTIESVHNSVYFENTIDGDAAGTRDLTVLCVRSAAGTPTGNVGTIFFGGQVGATESLRNLFLNYTGAIDGRAYVPSVATIVARSVDPATGSVPADSSSFNALFNVTDTFRMGQNEKLSSAGSLTIKAGGSAIVGDLNSLGDMTVQSPQIRIVRRAPGTLLSSAGKLTATTDTGVDIVSGGIINFTSTPDNGTPILGSGAAPQFSTPEGQRGPSAGTLAGFLFRTFGSLTFDQFNVTADFPTGQGSVVSRTLDLKADGPTSTDPATINAGAIPREARFEVVGQDTTISQASKEELRQNFNIWARDPTATEMLDILSGGAMLSDVPNGLRPTAQEFTTVTTRLPADAVESLIADYRDIFFQPDTDSDGAPVIDPKTHKPKLVSRAAEIRKTLTESVTRFMKGKSGDVNAAAYIEYVESSPDETAALGYLRRLHRFFVKLDNVGLTPRELRLSSGKILAAVRPQSRSLKPDVFETIVKEVDSPANR